MRPNIATRLAAEKSRYMGVLETLGAQLKDSLPNEVVETSTTPTRDWCRAFSRYQTGLADLSNEQLRVAKLQMLRERMGGGSLTDEEYEAGLAELASEAVAGMELEVLRKALAERGLTVVAVDDDQEDDE